MEEVNRAAVQRDGVALLESAPLFVAAAHELKSPLALIRQLALTIELEGELSRDVERVVEQIVLTSERALRLTTDLTKTARLEDSLFALEPLNPVSLCEEVVEELAPLYRAKNRTLRLTPRSRPLLGLANRDLLRRILLGFADNALHYASDTNEVIVSAKSYDRGERIRLGVRDYGPALPAQVWHHLEHTLGKSAAPLHARPNASGLGMYIAGQFAEAMNAEIGAIRHQDGATFYVDISASTQTRLL